jgi:MoaA/NifB/PqqE/SkfB family radical SAM enzyme/SAM-dependent methyltransferase
VAFQKNAGRTEMGDEDVTRAVAHLKTQGGFYVTFTGGEVLLKLDRVRRIIESSGKKSMLYQVQTNGVLLTDRICRELKAMGVDNVQISFDTFHETADWRKVLKTKERQLSMVRRHGMDVFFTWLASHQSLSGHEIRDVIAFSNRHRVKIGLNFAVPQGMWKDCRNMLLTPEDSFKLREISRRNPYLYIDLENNLMNYGCPAFSERFHVNAYGDVQPCTFFQISFGNIRNESLETILSRGRNHRLFQGFPDHCPPAENREYIEKWFRSDFKSLPVPQEEFFKDETAGSSCVICGSPVSIPFLSGLREVEYGTGWSGSLSACVNCGLIQQAPMQDASEALSWYPKEYIHYNPSEGWLKQFLMKVYMGRTVRLLKNLRVEKGMKLLDIGCGAGEKLAILRDSLGLCAEGVEPDRTAVEKARSRFGLDVRQGFFSPGDYPENSFDVVRINHVIEHVPSPVALLNGIHRVLKPGGILVGETENIECPSFRIFGKYWALLHLPYHLVLFAEGSLREAFRRSLFLTTRIQSTGDAPAWSLSLQNVLRRNMDKKDRKSSRMRGYIFLTLLSVPLSALETRLSRGPVLVFHAEKRKDSM